MKKNLLPLILSSLLGLSSSATELSGLYWLISPSGDATIGKKDIIGTRFNLKDDLGYDDEISAPGGTLILGDVFQFGASVFYAESDAVNTVSHTIKFSDLEFPVSSKVSSKFDATIGRAFIRLRSPGQGFNGGIEIGGLYTGLSAEANAPGIGNAETSVHAGVPYIGAVLTLNPIGPFVVRGEGRISKWDVSNYEAEYLEYEVSARLNIQPFFIGGGYRRMDIQVTDSSSNIDADLVFKGPIIYAGFEW